MLVHRFGRASCHCPFMRMFFRRSISCSQLYNFNTFHRFYNFSLICHLQQNRSNQLNYNRIQCCRYRWQMCCRCVADRVSATHLSALRKPYDMIYSPAAYPFRRYFVFSQYPSEHADSLVRYGYRTVFLNIFQYLCR